MAASFSRSDDLKGAPFDRTDLTGARFVAVDVWLRKAIQGVAPPYHPLGQANADAAAEGVDMSAFVTTTPPYAEVLAERVAMVRDFLATVTPEELDEPRTNPWSSSHRVTVRSCLHTILEEAWEHHRYAVRDLDAMSAEPHAIG